MLSRRPPPPSLFDLQAAPAPPARRAMPPPAPIAAPSPRIRRPLPDDPNFVMTASMPGPVRRDDPAAIIAAMDALGALFDSLNDARRRERIFLEYAKLHEALRKAQGAEWVYRPFPGTWKVFGR